MKNEIEQVSGVRVCLNTIRKKLVGWGTIFAQEYSPNYGKRKYCRSENKIKRATFLEKLFASRANGRTLVRIDETDFNHYSRRRGGCSRIGAQAAVVLPASKGANLHCIEAMTSSKRVFFKSQDSCARFRQLIDACAANDTFK